jgi:hypothetical protein
VAVPARAAAAAAAPPIRESAARTAAQSIRTAGSAGEVVHRLPEFSPSTPWGGPSYPEPLHSGTSDRGVCPAHRPVYLWARIIHRLWRTEGPSTGRQSCPRSVPRIRVLVPRFSTVLHRNIPSSATSIRISLPRVKEATECCQRGWGELPPNLGTVLGKTWGQLNCPVGEARYVHSRPSLSTAGSPGQCG